MCLIPKTRTLLIVTRELEITVDYFKHDVIGRRLNDRENTLDDLLEIKDKLCKENDAVTDVCMNYWVLSL